MLRIRHLCLITCDARPLLLQVKAILFLDFSVQVLLYSYTAIHEILHPISPKIGIHFVKRPSQVLLPQNRFYQSATQQPAAHQQPSLTPFPCREKQNELGLGKRTVTKVLLTPGCPFHYQTDPEE